MTDGERDAIAQALGISARDFVDILSNARVRKVIEKAIGRHRQTPKRRGPRATWTPREKRELAREFEGYSTSRRLTRAALIPLFIKARGPVARANNSRDGLRTVGERRLANLIGEGTALREHRARLMANPQFRRWAIALRGHPAFRGALLSWGTIREALDNKSAVDFGRAADVAEAARMRAEHTLLGYRPGDCWPGSFFILSEK